MSQEYPQRRPAFLDRLEAPDFKAAAAEGCFVYCYLRTTDGSPYYVGIASQWKRPTQPHNSCGVPRTRARIRILRAGLAWEEACRWEQVYIARWGRKDLGTGVLHNRTDGGDGTLRGPGRRGVPHDDETKQKIRAGWDDPAEHARRCEANRASWSEAKRAKRGADSSAMHASVVAENAALAGLTVEDYLALGATRRHELVQRAKGNMRPLLTSAERREIASRARFEATAEKIAARLGVTVDEYKAMNARERQNLSRRVARIANKKPPQIAEAVQ
jgi:hypothetical protein